MVVIQSREVPQGASLTLHVWDVTPNCTFGVTRRTGRLGRLPRSPAFPVEIPTNRGALAAGSGLSDSRLRQGTPEGGARGTTAWSAQAATSSSKKSCSSPGVVCGDFLSVSCLLCSPSTPRGLQHPHPLSKNSALQIAMISVRMILCIKIIHFAPLNVSALKPRPFRQRDFTFTPMCPCQGQP